jgi:hypothetical protein
MPFLGGAATSAGGVLLPRGKYVQLGNENNLNYSMVLNREAVMGFLLAPQTIDRLGTRIRVAGGAGAVLRLGVRLDDDGSVGAPVVEGTVPADGGTGWTFLSLDYDHPGGIFWVSVTGQGWGAGVAPQIQQAKADGPSSYLHVPGAPRTAADWPQGNLAVAGIQDGVAGALPAGFVNAATITTDGRQGVTAARRAAV